MNLLREYIREILLTESARTPAELPDDTYVTIAGTPANVMMIFYSDKNGNQKKRQAGAGDAEQSVIGRVDFNDRSEIWRPDRDSCLQAYQVAHSHASHGWGPLLYDVAMEVAGSRGLTPDKTALSHDAYSVWSQYLDRGDVTKKQLDDTENTLTGTPKDNCETDSAENFAGMPMDKDDLLTSPVMKVYTKGPTTIQQLEKMEKLIRK